MRTWLKTLFALALVASLALNVALARRARASVVAPVVEQTVDRPSAHAVREVPVAAGPNDCALRLAACERHSWDLVELAIAAAPTPSVHRDAGTAEHASDTAAAAQSAALCTAAERSLREQWERERPTMIANLTRSFGDSEEQERNVEHEIAAMSEVAGLRDADRAALAAAYRTARLARVDEARAALAHDPPDTASLLTIARGLFADEDAVLERIGGAAARDAWRTRQLEGRSVVLAIAATIGDHDWDGAIGW